MYRKWNDYTKVNPIKSLILAAIFGSLIGITIEFILHKDFNIQGFIPILIVLLVQLRVIKKNKQG